MTIQKIKNKKLNKFLIVTSLFLVALPTFASCSPNDQIQNLHNFFMCWVIGNMMKYIPVLILVALVVFLSGVVKFVASGDNEEARQSGRQVMIYGIIILFVMVSTWGIVGLIYNSFFPGDKINLPDALPPLQSN